MESHFRFRRQLRNAPVPDPFPVEVGGTMWVDSSNSDAFNFSACMLETGEDAYVARANINFQVVNGFATRHASEAYIPYGCIEHVVKNYQVLSIKDLDKFHWLPGKNGNVPKTAVTGGKDSGELQYIGRTCSPLTSGRTYRGATITLNRFAKAEGCRLGKVFPPHRCLYIPFNGGEYIFDRYEVLCYKPTPGKLKAICKWKILAILKKYSQNKEVIDKLPLPHEIKRFLQQ